jgi:hypothetical protein
MAEGVFDDIDAGLPFVQHGKVCQGLELALPGGAGTRRDSDDEEGWN